MTFLNPWILIGLSAATIPVILHLLNLRKLKSVEFSSLRFLKELQKTKIRRLKIKQIILLILRTLLIISIVMAFARPTIQSPIPFMSNYAKTSVVILLDNSFSMDLSDALGNRFNQAKNTAQNILNSLHEGDEAAIIALAGNSYVYKPQLSRNLNLVKDEMSKVKISGKISDIFNSFKIAEDLLEDSKNLNKEVYIISDIQKNIFKENEADSIKLFANGASLYFVRIGEESNAGFQNLSVDSIHVANRVFQVGKNVEVEAYIKNHSSKEVKGLVTSLYFNNERVAQRSIDIKENEIKNLIISASPQKSGAIDARVEIENDALDADNDRFFGFVIPEKPDVAVIGSKDKIKYISMALSSKNTSDEAANVKFYSPNELAGINLSNLDLVIIAGGDFRESDFQRLSQYVKNGGSVFIFADDECNRNIFANGLKQLGFGELSENSYTSEQPAQFSSVDKQHPLFEGVFKGTTEGNSIIESPKIYKALFCSQGQSLIDINGGSFLRETRPENGIALYCAVSANTNWSSFPVTGLFPVILFRSIFYLGSHEQLGTSVIAGNSLMLELPKRFSTGGNFKIIDPNKEIFYRQAAVLPSGVHIPFDNLDRLGNYAVFAPDSQPVTVFSVNFDRSESDIMPLSKNDVKKILEKRLESKAKIDFIENTQNMAQSIARARTGTELWQLFLLLAILIAISEMLVARSSAKAASLEG